jgi:aminopeptidase N
MFDESAPIADARRLDPGSEEYQSVIVNKGAMVFHMLRSIIGDANFAALLKDYYSHYSGKPATIDDFEKLAESRQSQPAPQDFKLSNGPPPSTEAVSLRPFFTQWLHSTGIPEFNLEYVVYRTKKGFRIVGKAKSRTSTSPHGRRSRDANGRNRVQDHHAIRQESQFSVETTQGQRDRLDPHVIC